ncbi:MAG: hypothetical protein QOE65_378 [Solirubrobacteraceae bacterium]|nr:hypothetical protein [Solirubrobacteraceae bacterium]
MSTCASCGRELAPDHRFCPGCGAARDAPGPAGGTEREARKVVSALFCDVVGSTALGERLDPEDFTTVVGGAVARMARAVEEFGGSVVELAGDGLLALFGAPAAHEDDAERAVRAGLRIVERIEAYRPELARRWGVDDFAVRVGIETGLVVLGPLGAGRKVEYSAMGDALNTAARLQAAADPGTVLAGERTQRDAAGAFRWGPARELDLKGKAGTVTAYPVEGVSEAPAAAAPVEAPLVGRAGELAAGDEALAAVRRGTGGALFVVGEGGIGKSRLVRELRERFASPGAGGRWLQARCASYGQDVPYDAVRSLLLDWLRPGGDGEPAQRLRAAARELLGDAAAEAEPFLLALLDEPGAGGPDLAPEGVQARTQEAVTALVFALAARGPLVVAVDDLHWADPSTLDVLDALLELTDESALLLVLSARPERDHGAWALRERALRDLPHRAREVRLDVLAGDDDRALLEALVGRGALPADLERRILDRAEGNPFYLEETVRALLDAGALERTARGWRLADGAQVEVPETVEKLVLSRIDRLDPAAHDVVSAAAVLGRQFELPVLERLADGADVRPSLRALQRLELVREGRRWPVPEYSFRHSLIQEAAYGALLRRHRQELHRRAAAAIVEVHGEDAEDQAGVLARHHHEAGDLEAAYALHGRAAEAALRIHAQEEALEHLDGALSAAAALGRGPEDAEVRRLFGRRGGVRHVALGDVEGAAADWSTAARGARAAGDRRLEVEALLHLAGAQRMWDWAEASATMAQGVAVARESGEATVLVDALGRQCIAQSNLLRLDTALELGEEALRVASASGGPSERVVALDGLKLAALMLGDLPRLDAHCRELLGLLDQLEADSSLGRYEPLFYRAWTLQEWSYVAAGAERWDEALARIAEGGEIVERLGSVTFMAMFLESRARVRRARGDVAGALADADAAVEHARRRANHEWQSWAEATAGWALLDAGREDEAVVRLQRALDMGRRAASPVPEVRALGLLAGAHARRGDREAARAAAEGTEARLAEASFPPGGAFLFGAHAIAGAARAFAALGEPDRARALAEPALAAAERTGWAEAKTDLAAALATAGAAPA